MQILERLKGALKCCNILPLANKRTKEKQGTIIHAQGEGIIVYEHTSHPSRMKTWPPIYICCWFIPNNFEYVDFGSINQFQCQIHFKSNIRAACYFRAFCVGWMRGKLVHNNSLLKNWWCWENIQLNQKQDYTWNIVNVFPGWLITLILHSLLKIQYMRNSKAFWWFSRSLSFWNECVSLLTYLYDTRWHPLAKRLKLNLTWDIFTSPLCQHFKVHTDSFNFTWCCNSSIKVATQTWSFRFQEVREKKEKNTLAPSYFEKNF